MTDFYKKLLVEKRQERAMGWCSGAFGLEPTEARTGSTKPECWLMEFGRSSITRTA